jgi:hypothetical protein
VNPLVLDFFCSLNTSVGLFIVDGIITIPIALLGFLIMPGRPLQNHPDPFFNFLLDLPTNTRPGILYTEEQIEIGKRRMEEIGRKPPSKFTKKKVLGFFTTWHIWLLVPRKYLFNCQKSSVLTFPSQCISWYVLIPVRMSKLESYNYSSTTAAIRPAR